MLRRIYIGMLCSCCCFMLAGQRPSPSPIPSDRFPTGDPNTQRSDSEFEEQLAEEPDTFGVFLFQADNPNQEVEFADTSLHRYFQQYDPARQRPYDWRTLGNLGSAAEPIVYQAPWRRGFDIGLHQFDLYITRADELPFYRLERPYTNLAYTQGSEQADGYLKVRFSRNFANGLNFSLYYDRISQIGRFDQFANQNTRNTTLGGGMWYISPNTRYKAFLSIVGNTIQQEDNGGLVTLPNTEGQFADPSSAQVFLEDGQTRHAHREFSYRHYYNFGGLTDSTGRTGRAYTLSHRIGYLSSRYKFFDNFNLGDTIFYNRYPALFTDGRGARFALAHRELENHFALSTFKLKDVRTAGQARDQRDLLEIGLLHRYQIVDMELTDSVINNLFLTGRLNFQPSERLRINTYAHLGILDNVGDYRLSGELFLDFKRLGNLRVQATSQLYRPTLMQERFYLSQQLVWQEELSSTLQTSLTASYQVPGLALEIGAGYHLINNFIYFDTTALVRQTGIPLSITQLLIRKDFRVGNFHLDNTAALQQASESTIRIPSVFAKHSLYYTGQWFRVLDVKLGVDVRYNTSYRPHYYNPFTGQFQLQDRQEVQFYPIADAFFSMRVTRFRAFVKYENATSLFINDGSETDILNSRSYFQTAYYLYPDAALRIGISWRLLD